MILAIKTDSMRAELSLLDKTGTHLQSDTWEAGRELAKDLLGHIDALVKNEWSEVTGIIVFRGPGSFTSLRIGMTTANTIAYAQGISIVGALGEHWAEDALERIRAGENDIQVLPEYGSDPHISAPKK